MSTQLDLPMENPDDAGGADAPPVSPAFVLTEERTPGEIVAWWDELVAAFTAVVGAAQARVVPLDTELSALKGARIPTDCRRTVRLRAERARLLGEVEYVEFDAYGTLSEFSPRLIELMQAEGLAIADDDEMAVGEFWDCLQRPALTDRADLPLRELVRHFCREHTG